jgi:hypothetical protein
MLRLALAAFIVISTASSTALANGPVGIGELKLGMTREQLDGINSDSVVHLTAPLAPLESKHYKHVPGVDVFTAMVKTPFDGSPLHGAFKFTSGRLISVSISLTYDSPGFETAREMIAARYGDPSTTDSTSEEQCVLRTGANYKVRNGKVIHSWWSESEEIGYVETQLVDNVLDGCSISRLGGGAIKSKSLVISRHDKKPKAPDNPF